MTVPAGLRGEIGKREIWETLDTTNRSIANALAAQKVLKWKGVFLSYEAQNGALSTKLQKERAAIQGFDFYTAQALDEASTKEKVAMLFQSNDFLSRVDTPTREQIAANSGVVEDTLSLEDLFARFVELNSAKMGEASTEQFRKKRNRYYEPITDFKREMGDLDVLKLTTKDAANYSANIAMRINRGDFVSATGEHKMVFLKKMIRKVFENDYPDRKNPFANAKVEHAGNDSTSRPPFSESEIISLHEKMEISTANDELKAILTLMEYTGAIVSEIVFLHESDFHLDGDIPYIHVGPNPNRKSLKTENRPRDIPLIGPALEAAKKFPKGFPRYCRNGGSTAFSAIGNKFIQTVSDKTCYSFRHRFVDLLREVEGMEDSWLKSIIGHDASMTGRYGKGYSLRKKKDAITKAMAIAEKEQAELIEKMKTENATYNNQLQYA